MEITRLKINGVQEPLGYSFDDHITVCWNVENASGKCAVETSVTVSDDCDFSNVIAVEKGAELSCTGVGMNIPLVPCTRYYVRVSIIDNQGDTGIAVTWFETGKMNEKWEGSWIKMRDEDSFHPVFLKAFSCENKIKSARLYISGLGIYEAYLNERRVGDEYLTPGLNDYDSFVQAQTYDITDYLQEKNQVEIFLGNGWYKSVYGQANGSSYGDDFALICDIQITFEDGSTQSIGTDESWSYRRSSIVDDGIYNGEFIDETLGTRSGTEQSNDKQFWENAVVTESPSILIDRKSIPVKVKEILQVKEVLLTPAGETVLDFGQNFAGWICFESELPYGTEVHFDFGEILQKDCFYNDNYRSAIGGFTYKSNGIKEVVRPHFTFFGFRYVRVTGWIGELKAESFEGLVLYSDLERTGFFQSGDEKINRLYENCIWGQKSNFIEIPTDCPQRDERLGWTGDAQVFSVTASYNMDTRAFYKKFLWDIQNEQGKRDGGIPAYAPSPKMAPLNACAAIWGDAATIIPDNLLRMFGDTYAAEESYHMMADWERYVSDKIISEHGTDIALWDFGFQFGDWLALDGTNEQAFKGDTPDDYIATLYYYHTVCILADFSTQLGKEKEQRKYSQKAEALKTLILDTFFTPVGHLSVNTQASYVATMNFDLYRDLNVLRKDFRKLLAKNDNQIRCGFVGAPILCQMLAKMDMMDLAWHFLLNEEYPGWLFEVNHGATTVWERWNSVLDDGSISGTGMNSLNHYSYGNVVEFLYAYVAGIRPFENGFQKAMIAPSPHGRLGYIDCKYLSAAGEYRCAWKIQEDGKLDIQIDVPFGCSAVIRLPGIARKDIEVQTGHYSYAYMPEVDYRRKYTCDSTLGEVRKDEEAAKYLYEVIPAGYMIFTNSAMRLDQLGEVPMLGITSDKMEELLTKLSTIHW